ncbi:MAG: hypothetical protein WC047_02535, partial [Kiritimatiellales bacterium]
GASGYISVDESGSNLLAAVGAISKGAVYLNPPLHKKIDVNSSASGQKNETPFQRLSHREVEVFCLTGHSHVPKRIADMLEVGVKTIETYRERIREKARADGRR